MAVIQMEQPTFNIMCANDVARRLNISKALVYQLVRRGEIPAVHIGKAVRIRSIDLEAYIQRNLSGWGGDQE